MGSRADKGAVAVVLAAGRGSRVGADGNKAYLPLAGRPMVAWTLASLAEVHEVARILLVARAEDRVRAHDTLRRELPGVPVEIIEGGSSRHDSEFRALQYLADDIRAGTVCVVLIHDAARPLAGPGLMRAALQVAEEFGGAVPALQSHDLIRVDADDAVAPVNDDHILVRVQTPQAFRAEPLLDAYEAAQAAAFEGTDTSSSVERYTDLDVRAFPGDERNLKVTYARDLFLAERLLADTHYRLS